MMRVRSLALPVRVSALIMLLIPNVACHILTAGTVGGGIVGAAWAPSTALVPGARVEVWFKPPRDLMLSHAGSRDTSRFYEAAYLRGRIHSVRGDTTWVAVTRVLGKDEPASFHRGSSPLGAIVARDGAKIRSLNDPAVHIISGATIGTIIAVPFAFLWYYAHMM